jgi:hypothetical protein
MIALPTKLAPSRRGPRVGLAEVYAGFALASFLVARFLPVLHLHYQCPFRTVTGLPCPTCGMTHAFVLLAHGDVLGALAWSPLGAAFAAAAWMLGAADLARVAAGWPLPVVPAPLVRKASLAGLAAVLVNWAWLVWHGLGPR